MYRKFLMISMVVLSILSLSLTSFAAKKIELRMSWWGSETRHRNTLEAIERYEEMNPDIDIIPEYSGFEGYRNKLFSQIMASNAPDIFTTVMEWYSDLEDADGMVDITGMVDVSGHNPKYVEACSFNGKMYGVNLSVNGIVLNQNVTLLKELGVEPLKAPYTWDDMVAKFKEVYEKSDGEVYGAADFTANIEGMGFDILKYYGYSKLGYEDAFPFNNEKFTIKKEDIQDFLQFFVDLRKSNAVAPVDISSMNDFSANSLLIQRVTAFEINFAGTFGRYQDQTTDDLQPVPLPVGENGENGDLARPGLIFSVSKNSKHVNEATKFIEWFTTSPEAAKILKNCRGVLPTDVQRATLLKSGAQLNDIDRKVMSVVDKILERDLKMAYAGPGGNGELGPIILPEISQMIGFGQMSVEEGADEFMNSIND
ncbi:extracellular solute-binding protein [Iocasia frigidifontis]|uniref:Extracellular solute-binding protein n=1 Tax=Iocasia fonsfrigidae TaxID=2682810 RepID=A0A8A7KMH8_9FIRM|nr:extracellular solute-binding protein [Iocasia fonsfrigidae]QTL99042.1 extracellular solute-binding protein [Iocasia fonsfrigidae]